MEAAASPSALGHEAFYGPDRDCRDFRSQREAQAFFEMGGGAANDRHYLDADDDGLACEALD